MSIPVVETIAEMRQVAAAARQAGRTIALVPTMGALHDGHASLIRLASRHAECVVVSVFVNPLQFGPHEDFARYPRDLAADRSFSAQAGAHMVFAPGVAEMYPWEPLVAVEVGLLGDHLCGPSRPGHFRGVCTVVLKLFNIVQPDRAVFGAKDAQQCRIIQRMVADLNVPVEILIGPTVREADGLALSSRNRYLSEAERAEAAGIYRALQAIQELHRGGESRVDRLESELQARLSRLAGSRIDYARIVDDATLQPIERVERPALAAVAVFLGKTRLIDNIPLA